MEGGRRPTQPENNKKSLNKNGSIFCCELLNRIGLGQSVMQTSTNLCLAFFEFVTILENKRFFQLDPVPQGNFIPSYRQAFQAFSADGGHMT